MKVVLDSNVYVSALAVPGGVAERALQAAIDGAFTVAISRPIITEVLGVLARKFARNSEDADVVVTGDRQMLALGSWEGIRIVALREFVDLIDTPRSLHQPRSHYGVKPFPRPKLTHSSW